jgi:hypothetical protein
MDIDAKQLNDFNISGIAILDNAIVQLEIT